MYGTRSVYGEEANTDKPRVGVVTSVDEADPLLVEVMVLPLRHASEILGPAPAHFFDRKKAAAELARRGLFPVGPLWWRYPPREDRTIDVPDDEA